MPRIVPFSDQTYARPALSLDTLSTYHVRINAFGANGLRLNGLLSRYQTFGHDSVAPAIDPFEGAVTPGANEYVVYTETSRRQLHSADVQGQTPLELFAVPGGRV